MGKKWNVERIECYADSYQIDIVDKVTNKNERVFVRRDAFFALIAVAERNKILEN